MEKFAHFDNSVSAAIQHKILAVAEYAQENYINEHGEHMSETREVEEISGVAYSGFIPFQDGGYSARAWYISDADNYRTDAERNFNSLTLDDCFDAFCHDNGIDDDAKATFWDDPTEEMRENLYEYEREWFQDGAFMTLDVYCRTGKSNTIMGCPDNEIGVLVHLKLNYSDTYGRDKYADTLYEKQYSFAEFKKLSAQEIIADITYS